MPGRFDTAAARTKRATIDARISALDQTTENQRVSRIRNSLTKSRCTGEDLVSRFRPDDWRRCVVRDRQMVRILDGHCARPRCCSTSRPSPAPTQCLPVRRSGASCSSRTCSPTWSGLRPSLPARKAISDQSFARPHRALHVARGLRTARPGRGRRRTDARAGRGLLTGRRAQPRAGNGALVSRRGAPPDAGREASGCRERFGDSCVGRAAA